MGTFLDHIREEYREIARTPADLRNFGRVVGGILFLIGLFIFWRNDWQAGLAIQILAGLGGGIFLLGLVYPRALMPLYLVWMTLAVVLGYIMTRVILTAVFYGIVTPIGLIFKLIGKDPMQKSFDRDQPTYWIPKNRDDDTRKRLERYF